MTDNDRPQDVGRRHAPKRSRGAEDPLLARYQRVQRDWLTRTLDELEGREAVPGLLPAADVAGVREYPKTDAAIKLWDLAVKLARELGSAIDPQPAATGAGRRPPRPRRAAY